MKKLTKRQIEILNFFKKYKAKNSFPPTMREAADHFGMSVKGVYDHIKALEKKGAVRCSDGKSRAIEILDSSAGSEDVEVGEVVNIPLLGNIAAGVPLLAEENLEGYIPVSARFIKKGQHFALRIKGDSMEGAGILNGDIALLRQQATAENGNIVAVRINEEGATLKRFYKEANRIKLKAENPVYMPIYTQNARVLGKLVTILRYYE